MSVYMGWDQGQRGERRVRHVLSLTSVYTAIHFPARPIRVVAVAVLLVQ